MPTTIPEAVEQGLPMVITGKIADVKAYIESELIHLAASVNVDPRFNFQKHQIEITAKYIIDTFRTESMEDVSVCFRNGLADEYGIIYRLDTATVMTWMRKYLEHKYVVIENNVKAPSRKDDPVELKGGTYLDNMKKLFEGWYPGESVESRDKKYEEFKRQRAQNKAKENEDVQTPPPGPEPGGNGPTGSEGGQTTGEPGR